MRLQDNRYHKNNPYARKEDREWDLAGLARQDNDTKGETEHTIAARNYSRLAMEWERNQEPG